MQNILNNKVKIKHSYILVITFAFLIWLSAFLIIPPLKTPDETEHYKVVKILANLKWPLLPSYPVEPTNSTGFEKTLYQYKKDASQNLDSNVFSAQAYHPPLYYFTSSLFYKTASLLKLTEEAHYKFTQFSSLIFFLVTILFLHKTLLLYFTVKYSVFFTLFASTLPNLVVMGGAINPEIGAAAMATIFYYLLLKFLNKRKFTYKGIAMFSLLSALAILFKLSNIILIPIFTSTLVILNLRKLNEVSKKLLVYVLLLVGFLSPWFFVNQSFYGKVIVDNFYLTYSNPETTLNFFNLIKSVFLDLTLAVINFFGLPISLLDIPLIFRAFYLVITILLILTGFLYAVRKKSFFKTAATVIGASFVSAFLFFSIFSFEVIYFYNHNALYGRYFLVLLTPLILSIGFGILYLSKKKVNFLPLLLFIFGFAILLLNFRSLLTL